MLRLLELESRCNPSCTCPGCSIIPTDSLPFISSFVGPQLLDTGVPVFASLPGAKHTIYLDFDGHLTENSLWSSYNGSPIYTRPFDVDSNPSTFSSDEQDRIRIIVQAVIEDFAPFNVNVTTIEPPYEDLNRSDAEDSRWGVRVCIGGHYQDWYGPQVAGAAYIGSFNFYNKQTPAMVFAGTLFHTPKYIWEAVSHEVGHTLGLSHNGTTSPSKAYYEGHGSGPTGWAPIMGASYYRERTTWSNGNYPFANNKQDQLAIITSNNGFDYRQDDYIAPVFLGANLEASGIIERREDVDVFSFVAGWENNRPGSRMAPTRITVQSPVPWTTNLDIKLTVRTEDGIIAAFDPIDSVSIDATVMLRAGMTFQLHIEGTGSAYYDDYGSLGQYVVKVYRP